MRKLLVNALNCITGGKKDAIFIFCQEEKTSIELYDVQKCLYIESDPVSSLCPSVGISFAKELQGLFCKEHISLWTPLPFPGTLAA